MIFTDEQINNLVDALPGCVDPHRRRLLPRVLREWSQNDLREHLARLTPKQIRIECQRIRKVATQALELDKALQQIGSLGRFCTAGELLKAQLSRFDWADFTRIARVERRLAKKSECLKPLATAAVKAALTLAPSRVHHKTRVGHLILQDLAAIYQWGTGKRPGRRIKTDIADDAGQIYGPFWDFASVAWPIVFGSPKGLQNALKLWAATKKLDNGLSPIIFNIHIRHSEWRIL